MNRLALGSRVLLIVGVIGMLVGAIDPLEGSPLIVLGTALSALGAALAASRGKTLLYWGLALVTIGVGAMFVLSAFGGIGGDADLSIWWGVFIVPYPVGWIAALVGACVALVESFRHPRVGQVAP